MIKFSKGMLIGLCASALAHVVEAQTIQTGQITTQGMESQML